MLKQHAAIFRKLMIAADLALMAVSFVLAYLVRNKVDALYPLSHYGWLLVVLAVIWGYCLYFSSMYASFRLKTVQDILFTIYQSAYFCFFIFASLCYLLRLEHVSRVFVILIFVFAVIFTAAEKAVIIFVFRHLRKKGFNYRNIIIVGTGHRAQKLIREIDANQELGLKIFGVIDSLAPEADGDIAGHPWIGTMKDIPEILRQQPIDHIIFVVPRSMLGDIEEPILFCETVGVTTSVALDFFNLKLTTGRESSFMGFPILTFETTPQQVWSLMVKRVLDVMLSLAGLIVVSPLLILTALAVKLSSPGPVFFRQTRCGLNGRRFTLYKFRTMKEGADRELESLRQKNEMQGPVFKMENDPRVTPWGRFLRKFSIDELPQLWNVWKGDMSLVGPRPPIDREVDEYDYWQRRRLSMRPGITCIWQVKGRNKIVDFKEWIEMDLQYIDNWSLWLDFRILLKTVPVVLGGVGAK